MVLIENVSHKTIGRDKLQRVKVALWHVDKDFLLCFTCRLAIIFWSILASSFETVVRTVSKHHYDVPSQTSREDVACLNGSVTVDVTIVGR